jgi:hypothetical protein
MKELSHRATLLLTLALLAGTSARGWSRKHYSDSEVVSRAELIVVAKVQEGSLILVPHEQRSGAATSWEHHVRLLVSEVLKGTNASPVLAASIHYGLEPIVGGYLSNQFGTIIITNIATYRTGYCKDAIQVFDRGSSLGSFAPISGDIRTNHIWLLRSLPSGGNSDLIGIHDPEDIQRIEKRGELLKALRREK